SAPVRRQRAQAPSVDRHSVQSLLSASSLLQTILLSHNHTVTFLVGCELTCLGGRRPSQVRSAGCRPSTRRAISRSVATPSTGLDLAPGIEHLSRRVKCFVDPLHSADRLSSVLSAVGFLRL